jgi:hypothetical protein
MTYYSGSIEKNSTKKNKSNYLKPKITPSYINGNSYLWFLKPTNTNRGRGIFIFNTLEELENYIF